MKTYTAPNTTGQVVVVVVLVGFSPEVLDSPELESEDGKGDLGSILGSLLGRS